MTNGRMFGVTLELVVNSCWPIGRCNGNIAGKIRNLRQAAMTSGKLMSVSCDFVWDSKTLGFTKKRLLDRLSLIICRCKAQMLSNKSYIRRSVFMTAMMARNVTKQVAIKHTAVGDTHDGNMKKVENGSRERQVIKYSVVKGCFIQSK